MTVKKALWTVFAVAAAIIVVVYFSQTTGQSSNAEPTPETSATPKAQSTPQGPNPTPAEVDRGNGFSQLYPDADQAPEQADEKKYEHKEIKPPTVPAVDPQKPDTVAQAFLTVYNSRSSETDQSWQETVKPWITPDLAEKLPTVTNGSLTDKTPAAVTTAKVGEHVNDWGADTPLRWSHQIQVTMDTQDHGTYLIDYRVQAQLTDQGWLINTAKLDTWQRVEK